MSLYCAVSEILSVIFQNLKWLHDPEHPFWRESIHDSRYQRRSWSITHALILLYVIHALY